MNARRSLSPPLRLLIAAVGLACSALGWRDRGGAEPRGLPPIVFVSRQPPSGAHSGQIPGLGPHGSAIAGGGRLLLREPSGAVRDLLPPGAMYDVQDPDVSWDARRVVFSGLETPEARWRLYVLTLASDVLEPLTADADHDGDDFDPCWNGNGVVFARTTRAARSLYDSGPAAALYEWRPEHDTARLVVREANGALDPTIDARRGTLVFARWWFNPWLPRASGGVTRDAAEAMTRDSVNQWQVIELGALGERLRAGGVSDRRAGMGVQPAILGDAIIATYASNPGLAPRPGPTGLHRMGMPPSAGQRLAGAAIGDDLASPYSEGTGLSAPSACAAAALLDGRLVFSFAAGARGDFGLWLLGADGSRSLIFDLPGSLELDAAPVVQRPGTPIGLSRVNRAPGERDSFRFFDADVYRGLGAPRRQVGARLRFFALHPSAPDSLEPQLVTEVSVPRGGRIDVRVPRRGPMFEQLVGADGRMLMSAHGPAQVRGFNTPPAGGEARCIGCHLGHSTLQ